MNEVKKGALIQTSFVRGCFATEKHIRPDGEYKIKTNHSADAECKRTIRLYDE